MKKVDDENDNNTISFRWYRNSKRLQPIEMVSVSNCKRRKPQNLPWDQKGSLSPCAWEGWCHQKYRVFNQSRKNPKNMLLEVIFFVQKMSRRNCNSFIFWLKLNTYFSALEANKRNSPEKSLEVSFIFRHRAAMLWKPPFSCTRWLFVLLVSWHFIAALFVSKHWLTTWLSVSIKGRWCCRLQICANCLAEKLSEQTITPRNLITVLFLKFSFVD